MAYRYGIDRNQLMMLPPVLDQYVTHDHPVRAYDAFVEALNFRELGISLDERKVGNSQYDPRSMLKLLLYGYSYGGAEFTEAGAGGSQQFVLYLADAAAKA